jgi:hypothetical protein
VTGPRDELDVRGERLCKLNFCLGGGVFEVPLSKRLKINGWQDIRPSDTELVQLFWFFILKSQVSNALKKKNSLSWCNGSSSKSVCLDSSARP